MIRVPAWETANILQCHQRSSHPQNVIWGMSAEIPYQWCVTTQIWVVIGWSKFSTDSKPSSKNTPFISILFFLAGWWSKILKKHFSECGGMNVKFYPLSWIDVFLSRLNHRIKPQAIWCIRQCFFLMSFGTEVIVVDFLSPFVRLTYMFNWNCLF